MPMYQINGFNQVAAFQAHILEDIEKLQSAKSLINETLKKIKESR